MSDPIAENTTNYAGPGGGAPLLADAQARAVRKVLVRLVPLAMFLYMLNYLDRVNVSFAQLTLSEDLKFNAGIYGFGASIYFIGYFFFEVPSNLILHRVGARRWIARIMISWGIVATAMMFVEGKRSFYALRFLLGIAEAGFFPGIMLYFTYWIPARQRSRVGSVFFTSTAIASIIGSPISGKLLEINALGLKGWQWLFLLEGIPSILMGVVVLLLLPNGPAEATWLKDDELAALTVAMDAEKATQHPDGHQLLFALKSGTMWVLAAQYALILYAFYGLVFWTPSIIKAACGPSLGLVGVLTAVPFGAAIGGMVLIGYMTDFLKAPRAVIVSCALLGAAGMAACAASTSTGWIVAWLSLAAVGIYGTFAPFWSLPPTLLRGAAAAAGIAIINSIGNLGGGFIGPNVAGQLKDKYGSYGPGLLWNAAVLVLAAGIAGAVAWYARSGKAGSTRIDRA